MATQFVKLYDWMTGLGLSAAEMIAYAFVYAYTGFKGGFDGSAVWLSKWIGISARETTEVLESLSVKGLIYSSGRRGSAEVFKSTAIAGLAAPQKAAKPGNGNTGNTIDTIDTIDNNTDPIEKKNNNNTIDHSIEHPIDKKNNNHPIGDPIERSIEDFNYSSPIGDPIGKSIERPIAYTKKAPARKNGPEPIGRIAGDMAVKKPSPAEDAYSDSHMELLRNSPPVKALFDKYGDITDIPIFELVAALKEAEELYRSADQGESERQSTFTDLAKEKMKSLSADS